MQHSWTYSNNIVENSEPYAALNNNEKETANYDKYS